MIETVFIVLGRIDELDKITVPLESIDSPARTDDYIATQLNLTEHLAKYSNSIFYLKSMGNLMSQLGIYVDDILIVDRLLEPKHGDVVILTIDGNLTCKVLECRDNKSYLMATNPNDPLIPLVDKKSDVWGVVIHNIHSFKG